MYNKNAYARFRHIDARLTMKQKTAPSLQELVDFVSDRMEMTISVSSIQKDIYAMRFDSKLGFDAPIEFDRKRRAYYYTDEKFSINNIPLSEEDLQSVEMAVGLLEQFKNIPAIKVFDEALSRISASVKQSRTQQEKNKIVITDRPRRYLGIEFMQPIADAIREKHIMRLAYLPFNKNDIRKHQVHPYFIKEYQGRMYLIAKDIHPTKEAKFLTFSFDRIQDVVSTRQVFEEEQIDQENYFKSALGISMKDQKVEKIILHFNPAQKKYLQSQPLHHSQQIIKDTAKTFAISLELIVNYELKTLLLGYGNDVEIIKPLSLRNELITSIKEMQKIYNL
ncbi:MAG: WYL domain-containing protein [Chitinophagaceae bacterium]|nr:WYL domain-containing protein [Chitinophagaceae bacterium]